MNFSTCRNKIEIFQLKKNITFLISLSLVSFFSLGKTNLKEYNSIEKIDNIFKNKEITDSLKTILKDNYGNFINNFDVVGEPHLTKNEGLFAEGWMMDLYLYSASAMVIEPDGDIFVAWVTPETSKIEYRTNSVKKKEIDSDIESWGKRFSPYLSFKDKEKPDNFIESETSPRYFISKNFIVKVTFNCDNKNAICNDVTYDGERKHDHAKIKLSGKAIRYQCETYSCPINSYEFKNHNVIYTLNVLNPSIEVSSNGKMIVNEPGEWSDSPH
ncbi:hypothetical protein HC231_08115 [Brenneria izadpanahii]|uniref:Uncharacterized protein n=1 Tax=Brenneria izadpanahii TaxID=2722756 RepID=A0ABX7URI3_9GAMM|nr:hypothetical protein HC231_08115 [Brenneria izadpanahii]